MEYQKEYTFMAIKHKNDIIKSTKYTTLIGDLQNEYKVLKHFKNISFKSI